MRSGHDCIDHFPQFPVRLRDIAIKRRSWSCVARGLLWLLIALWLGFVVASDPEADSGLIPWVKERYGEAAAERVSAWRQLMSGNLNRDEWSKLVLVNDFFNRLRFSTDFKLWGKEDYWATPVEALGKGGADCEDYSIAKYFTLRELGVPDDKLRIMYVKALELDQAHMVLAYYKKPGSIPVLLDNIDKAIVPADQRPDLAPVYSFNANDLWLAKRRGRGEHVGTSDRIGLWRDLRKRMEIEGEQ